MPDCTERWTYYKEGNFNKTYVNKDKTEILKIAKTQNLDKLSCQTDTPGRSVRLWNLINPGLSQKPRILVTAHGIGWVCPFVSGVQASTKEIHDGLIEVFNRTGRIVVDAISPGNFIKTSEGRIVCIDIGMALALEPAEEGLRRIKSEISLASWQYFHETYRFYFIDNKRKYPYAVHTIRALLFIKEYCPEVKNVDFLKGKFDLIVSLSEAYETLSDTDSYDLTGIQKALANAKKCLLPHGVDVVSASKQTVSSLTSTMGEETDPVLKHTKQHCYLSLQAYMDSRGEVKSDKFIPSWTSRFFRRADLTKKKVLSAKKVQAWIQQASSLSEIGNIISAVQADSRLMGGGLENGFKACLTSCEAVLQSEMSKASTAQL